jgi:hypothetical protein
MGFGIKLKVSLPLLILTVIAVAIPTGVGLGMFQSQEKWKQDLLLALLHDSNPLEENQVLVPAALGECRLYRSPEVQAEILVWTTLHFNERNAHAGEQLIETAAFSCKNEYLTLANRMLSSPATDKLDLHRKEVLAEFAKEIERIPSDFSPFAQPAHPASKARQ